MEWDRNWVRCCMAVDADSGVRAEMYVGADGPAVVGSGCGVVGEELRRTRRGSAGFAAVAETWGSGGEVGLIDGDGCSWRNSGALAAAGGRR